MTWAGENSTSGVMTFTEDGTPGNAIGSPGDILTWGDPTSIPEFVSQSSITGVAPLNLSQIGDVSAVNPDVNQFLGWNGSQWAPENPQGEGGPRAYTTGAIDTITTSAILFNDVPDMTLSVPSGEWHVLFSAAASHNKNSQQVVAAIFIDGVQIEESHREIGGQANNIGNFNCQALASTTGQPVVVRWRQTSVGGGGPVATMFERSLFAIEVDVQSSGI